MINEAIIFATIAHSNQYRKGTDIPYIFHPMEAASIVAHMTSDADLICAAILHDTIEDTHVSSESIEKMFNKRVADLIISQSEDKTKSWKERKAHTIDYLSKVDDEGVKIVSLADKLSNIRPLYRDMIIEGDSVWNRFNEKNKNEQAWYYKGLVDSLSSIDRFKEFREFKEYVSKVFCD